MAVPWQTDTASCRSGYEGFTPSTPTFWAARVPNHVLSEEDYETVVDTGLPLEQRREAFRRRQDWLRLFGSSWAAHIQRMIKEFGNLGVVEPRPGPNDKAFPAEIYVESQPKAAAPTRDDAPAAFEAPPPQPVASDSFAREYIPKVDRFRRPK
jgi:hypothetical protein